MFYRNQTPRRRGNLGIGLLVAVLAIVSYCSSQEVNTVTGKTQYLAMSTQQEIALGLQTAPVMAEQYGGLSKDPRARARVTRMGEQLVEANRDAVAHWQFDFHLLRDPQTVNAFALPGGQVFITHGLLDRLQSDAQLTGVLAHEMGHVIGRHSAAQLAKQQLSQGLTGAVIVASGDASNGQIAAMAGQLINLRYGREDELESDALSVRFMRAAGYNPQAMVEVLQILKQAGGPRRTAEFFSTHPDPDHRIERLQQRIDTRP